VRCHISILWVPVLCLSSLPLLAQVRGSKSLGTLQQNSGTTCAMQALTDGIPVHGVTESGTVVRTVGGGGRQQGSVTIQSSGVMNSELDLTTTLAFAPNSAR
jgi:hypothetical protein